MKTNNDPIEALTMVSSLPARSIPNDARELVEQFVETAHANDLVPVTLDQNPRIGVFLRDGTDVPALAVADDGMGNWTVLRESDRKVVQYLWDEVS